MTGVDTDRGGYLLSVVAAIRSKVKILSSQSSDLLDPVQIRLKRGNFGSGWPDSAADPATSYVKLDDAVDATHVSLVANEIYS